MTITRSGRDARAIARTLALAVVLLSAPAIALAQGSEADGRAPMPEGTEGTPEAVWQAQAFVLAAYPDLIDRPLAITLRQDADGAVLVSVAEDLAATSAEVPVPPLVTARVAFDADVRLTRYDAYGPLLHEAENLALQDQLIANPRWVDSDADVWLMRQGVRSTFGTALEVAPEARTAVGAQLGTELVAAPTAFRWYQESSAAGRVFRSRPAWIAETSVRVSDGTTRVYELEYEPFGGRLIAVTTRGAQ